MSQENLELVQAALSADALDDADAFWDPGVEWVVAKEHPGARTLIGGEAVVLYLKDWDATLADMRFEVSRVLDASAAVVAVGTVRGTGTVSGVDVSVPLALVCAVRDGRITRVEEYLNPAEALKAVGLVEE